jgi:predicted transposase/invertase (TIGR01784 family)
MIRYLSPKNDLIFKKIFGEHPDLLKSFLNAFLPLPADRLIEHLEYLPTEAVPEIPGFKYTIVDVRCRDAQGRQFIVEMQLQWSRYFTQRMLFNTAATYVRQLSKGEGYDSLCPVYGIAIVDDTFTDEPHWFHHYQFTHARDASKKLEDIQVIFLELPKFKPSTLTEKKLAVLWLRFLTEINEKTETVDSILLETPDIKKALSCLEVSAYTAAELRTYDANWDAISCEKTLSTDKYNQGLEAGRKEVARRLLQKGMDLQTVSDITGLDAKAIKAIEEI